MRELRWGVEPFNAAEWDALNESANTDDVDFADLVQTLSRRFVMLSVTHADPDVLARPAEQETVDYIETARTVISGSFADYWQSRKSSLKDSVRKSRNRMERACIKPRMVVVTDPATIGQAVDAFGLLESASWKGETALHPDNVQGAYYRDLFIAYAEKGWASAWQCWYGDSLVASNLLIHREGTVVSLKTSFDDAHASTSPSMLLRYETFERIWAETDVVEYYGKRPGWNYWETELRSMYHVNAYRSLLVRAVRNLARRLKQRAPSATVVPESA